MPCITHSLKHVHHNAMSSWIYVKELKGTIKRYKTSPVSPVLDQPQENRPNQRSETNARPVRRRATAVGLRSCDWRCCGKLAATSLPFGDGLDHPCMMLGMVDCWIYHISLNDTICHLITSDVWSIILVVVMEMKQSKPLAQQSIRNMGCSKFGV